MNTPLQDDSQWKALLAQSAPTFAGEDTPPYGFLTSTLARLKAEKRDRDILERIGFRALFASLAVLVAVGGLTVGIQLQAGTEFDPGVKSLIQVDHVPFA